MNGEGTSGTSVPVQKQEREFDLGGGYRATVSRIGRTKKMRIFSMFDPETPSGQAQIFDMAMRLACAHGRLVDGQGNKATMERNATLESHIVSEAFFDTMMDHDQIDAEECIKLAAFVLNGKLSETQEGN